MKKEIEIKWERCKRFLKDNELNGLIINKVSNFAWFTGGKINYVGVHTEKGASSLLITEKNIFLVSNNIEFNRIVEEELKDFDFLHLKFNWYEENVENEIKKVVKGTVKNDFDLSIEKLHFPLIDEEISRYKKLGKETSEIITEVGKNLKEGKTELEIAGKISYRLWKKNIFPVVLLIASDERIKKYRHPVAKNKKIKNNLMIVVCGRREGLIVSLTRIVSFGKIDEELKKKHLSCCKIDACFILNSILGNKVSGVFKKAIEIYEKEGYKDEWKLHHQGGPTGYLTRYYKANFNSNEKIEEKWAFAWNPSITGTKSEDTIITTENLPLIITEDKNWPLIEIEYDGKIIKRPDILVK